VADATVALLDKGGKVVAWTRTDKDGNYAIGSDCLGVLQLRPSRRRGFLAGLVRGVGRVVAAPVNLAANVVKQVDPVKTAKAAIVTAATGNALPTVSNVVSTVTNSVTDQASKKTREIAVKTVMGERQAAPPKEKREEVVPGEVRIAVTAPGYQEIKAKAGAYWMEAAEEPARDAPKEQREAAVGPRAWLELVKLAPAAMGDKKSAVENVAVLLAEPRLEPSLAPAGGTVRLSVKLNAPPPPPGRTLLAMRVFAREDKKHVVAELKPGEGPNANVYSGELVLDPKTPAGDTTITLVALRAEPVEVNLRESKTDPLLDFARGLDDLDADKPYEFDPRIMASENRLDVTLTILDPKQGTPTMPGAAAAAAPAAPPANAPAPAAPAAPTAPANPAPAQPAPAAPAPAKP
jgi:hypothetical protein